MPMHFHNRGIHHRIFHVRLLAFLQRMQRKPCLLSNHAGNRAEDALQIVNKRSQKPRPCDDQCDQSCYEFRNEREGRFVNLSCGLQDAHDEPSDQHNRNDGRSHHQEHIKRILSGSKNVLGTHRLSDMNGLTHTPIAALDQ